MGINRFLLLAFTVLCSSTLYGNDEQPSQSKEPEPEPEPSIVLEEMRNIRPPVPVSDTANNEQLLKEATHYKQLLEETAFEVPFLLLPHRPNYFMPITHQERPNDAPFKEALGDEFPGLDQLEAVFQLSVKYQVAKLPGKDNKLYLAYTNKSYWQVYNEVLSRPFRETNHEPEIIATFNNPIEYLNFSYLSLNHQSNGQYTGLSRSWNRIVLGLFHTTGNMVLGIQPWWRIPETSKADPEDPTDNDNPNIDDYLGYGEFIFLRLVGPRTFTMRVRNNLRLKDNYGAIELEWSFPITRRVKGFVQYFEGYGESLIEYDHYQKRIGFGFKISDYL